MAEIQKAPTGGNAEMAQRFVQFIMLQAQNILYVLGKIPSPDGRPVAPNLEAGKIMIDHLEMIQEKTQGNLSTREASILDDALRNVRLSFVEASGGTPASMMPRGQVPDFGFEGEDEADLADLAPIETPNRTEPARPTLTPSPAAPEENKKKFTKSYG